MASMLLNINRYNQIQWRLEKSDQMEGVYKDRVTKKELFELYWKRKLEVKQLKKEDNKKEIGDPNNGHPKSKTIQITHSLKSVSQMVSYPEARYHGTGHLRLFSTI